jgi:hypothetical protein
MKTRKFHDISASIAAEGGHSHGLQNPIIIPNRDWVAWKTLSPEGWFLFRGGEGEASFGFVFLRVFACSW